MKRFAAILILCCPLLLKAQSVIKPLDVGAAVPEVTLTGVLNYPSGTLRLSEFVDRLLILDFWATWCTGCLRQLPRMDSLEKRFDGQLQMLLVNIAGTGDNHQKVRAFFERFRKADGQKYELPTVVGDTVLSRLFPFQLLPHYVWIKGGKVVAITSAEAVTEAHIRDVLLGTAIALPQKKDVLNFDPKIGLPVNGSEAGEARLLYRSTLTRYLEGLPTGARQLLTPDSASWRLCLLNHTITNLYLAAAGDSFSNRIIIKAADLSRFLPEGRPWNQWAPDHAYCYELTVPRTTSQQALSRMMLSDLNRYLGLNGRIERRVVDCWVLCRVSAVPLKSRGGTPRLRVGTPDEPLTVLHNLPLYRLVRLWNKASGDKSPVVVDETGVSGPVDLELRGVIDNPSKLLKELNRYGLNLVRTRRVLPVLILSDSNGSPGNGKVPGRHP